MQEVIASLKIVHILIHFYENKQAYGALVSNKWRAGTRTVSLCSFNCGEERGKKLLLPIK